LCVTAINCIQGKARHQSESQLVNFLRVHKSFIVAMDKIDFIENNRIVVGSKYIPISVTYQEAFWARVKGK